MNGEPWKIHVCPVSQHHGYVWICRGRHDCYQQTGWDFHNSFHTHEGPRWRWRFSRRWWHIGSRTLDEALAAAREWLSAISNAEAMCRDAVEVERIVSEL